MCKSRLSVVVTRTASLLFVLQGFPLAPTVRFSTFGDLRLPLGCAPFLTLPKSLQRHLPPWVLVSLSEVRGDRNGRYPEKRSRGETDLPSPVAMCLLVPVFHETGRSRTRGDVSRNPYTELETRHVRKCQNEEMGTPRVLRKVPN